jgi:hypothetical protein
MFCFCSLNRSKSQPEFKVPAGLVHVAEVQPAFAHGQTRRRRHSQIRSQRYPEHPDQEAKERQPQP